MRAPKLGENAFSNVHQSRHEQSNALKELHWHRDSPLIQYNDTLPHKHRLPKIGQIFKQPIVCVHTHEGQLFYRLFLFRGPRPSSMRILTRGSVHGEFQVEESAGDRAVVVGAACGDDGVEFFLGTGLWDCGHGGVGGTV